MVPREMGEKKQKGKGSMSVLIHGADFVAVGYRDDIYDFKKALAGRFTVKDKVLGTDMGQGEIKETRVLNRILRIKPEGWEYEADQRHAELIVRGLGMDKAKSVKTPGEEIPSWKLDEEEQPIDRDQVTKFRMLAARANYLASDRPDIQYAVKECCRGMATPLRRHWNMLKRLARYLVGRERELWFTTTGKEEKT